MGPEHAPQQNGPEVPPSQTEVEVTPSQADAASLIIEIDSAAGRQTPGLIYEIARARPSIRVPGFRPPPGRQSPDEPSPTAAAILLIKLLPDRGFAG
jgi:hypothetical protein